MKTFLRLVAFILLSTVAVAFADSTVNQGTPGTRGPWPVKTVGSSSLDGGPGTNTITTFAPAATVTGLSANGTPCTQIGGGSCTTIYAAFDYGVWTNVTITLKNVGANTIDNVLVEWSPDGTGFEIWDSTTFAGLTSGSVTSIAIAGNSRRFLRIEARAAAITTASVLITANDG